MLFVYPAIFHKEDDAYWVEFPDLEGCHTFGSSINETMEAAQEALSAYLLTLLEQEKAIAPPIFLPIMRMTVFPPLYPAILTSTRIQRQ